MNTLTKQTSSNRSLKLKNLISIFIILSILLNFLILNSSDVKAQNSSKKLQDTSIKTAQEPIETYLNYNQNYIAKAELENQKLIRNIFAISFFFVLALLIFTMVFYGGKIKKVSNIIVLQDDALKSTKDQLIKIINIFNYIDQQVYITDSAGIIEWINDSGSNFFLEKYEVTKINLLERFSAENQVSIFKAIIDQVQVSFNDKLYTQQNNWKMVPIKNSKGEFSNMVFIC
jgi:hypothetical protein